MEYRISRDGVELGTFDEDLLRKSIIDGTARWTDCYFDVQKNEWVEFADWDFYKRCIGQYNHAIRELNHRRLITFGNWFLAATVIMLVVCANLKFESYWLLLPWIFIGFVWWRAVDHASEPFKDSLLYTGVIGFFGLAALKGTVFAIFTILVAPSEKAFYALIYSRGIWVMALIHAYIWISLMRSEHERESDLNRRALENSENYGKAMENSSNIFQRAWKRERRARGLLE